MAASIVPMVDLGHSYVGSISIVMISMGIANYVHYIIFRYIQICFIHPMHSTEFCPSALEKFQGTSMHVTL